VVEQSQKIKIEEEGVHGHQDSKHGANPQLASSHD
jgi:hypothetical protein